MPDDFASQKTDMEFIRILFTNLVEEEIAHRWASRLATLLGRQATELRPNTTLAEMLRWGAIADADSMSFAVIFEPELRMDLAEFLDHPEHVTFREMVEHCARRFATS